MLCRRAAIGSSRASDRQLAGRGSGDGSEHHLEDHAGTSPGKRNASHSRIVAGAGSERSGRPRLHRAVCRRKRVSEISCGRPCHDRRGPPAASPESEDSVPPTPARSKPAKAKPKAQKKVVPAESDVAGIAPCTDAKGKVRIQSQPRQAPRFPRTNEVARC